MADAKALLPSLVAQSLGLVVVGLTAGVLLLAVLNRGDEGREPPKQRLDVGWPVPRGN